MNYSPVDSRRQGKGSPFQTRPSEDRTHLRGIPSQDRFQITRPSEERSYINHKRQSIDRSSKPSTIAHQLSAQKLKPLERKSVQPVSENRESGVEETSYEGPIITEQNMQAFDEMNQEKESKSPPSEKIKAQLGTPISKPTNITPAKPLLNPDNLPDSVNLGFGDSASQRPVDVDSNVLPSVS